MSSVSAHTPSEGGPDRGAAAGTQIALAGIDRALVESAGVAHAGPGDPVRAWRDELAVARESLVYARAVLSADVGILRHRLSGDPGSDCPAADQLAEAMTARPWGQGWVAPSGSEGSEGVDWEIFARSDRLMSTHAEMARVDLSSADDVARVIGDMVTQLTELTLRQDAVEERLREIRAAIVRQYQEGAHTTEDGLR